MARMTDESVLAVRAVVQWIAKSLGVALVMIGFVGIVNRVFYGFAFGRGIQDAWSIVESTTGMVNGFTNGVPLVVCGLTLVCFGKPIARWIVRPAATGCAECGYPTAPVSEPCPECGRTPVSDRNEA
ncbi:MAG: hypothetical protein CMJ31_08800 [Phycisphaerae bacterium]|nr:hypothetical protein [Phycisphaerae bacterium]